MVIAALIGLNAVSYSRKDQVPDSEFFPNRSSYNTGATGSSAFYSLLTETGNKVVRWQQPMSALLSSNNSKISTLILIGELRRDVTPEDAEKILMWVNKGGRLVLIDRSPAPELLGRKDNWKFSTSLSKELLLGDKTAEPATLIEKVSAAKPVQPTVLMRDINAVQPSKLASQINIDYAEVPPADKKSSFKIADGYGDAPPPPTPAQKNSSNSTSSTPYPTPSPYSKPANTTSSKKVEGPLLSPAPKNADIPVKIGEIDTADSAPPEEIPKGPVIHLSNRDKDILVDVPFGNGRIFLLSDPYIVSNAGIKLVDNATLGLNLATNGGTIAFDEYHQGFGSENTFMRYFAGTPVPALLAQAILLVLLLLWTQGRRFARSLPMPAKDRRSKLEYIGAMADLQQSTRAYDLAIENVYTQTKRNMTRLVGADNTVSKKQLAEAVAERSGFEAKDLYILMSKCEDIIYGEPTNSRETMNLISQLRVLEEKLGLSRTKTSKVK